MYNRVLAAAAEPLMRIDARLRHGEILAPDRRILARGGDRQPGLPAVIIPADQLTYNLILLAGLFATNPAPLRGRGLQRFAIALAVLFVTHVLAVVVSLELTYATRTGSFGERHYSALEQDWWTAVEYGYRLVGMFGIAFGCWWLTRVSAVSADRTDRARSAA
ncbi:MAG TPA: hypothetical protein VFT12_12285 [Thermoanaerobaculia bacterium]|nr:hypothetical protein [Thermoanaerobaculia bacterium]